MFVEQATSIFITKGDFFSLKNLRQMQLLSIKVGAKQVQGVEVQGNCTAQI
jgi:hypothetical protein